MKGVQFNIIRSLISFEQDYTIGQAVFLIEQYILYRTNKTVKIITNEYTDIKKFEQAVTTAEAYFKLTYKKLWH